MEEEEENIEEGEDNEEEGKEKEEEDGHEEWVHTEDDDEENDQEMEEVAVVGELSFVCFGPYAGILSFLRIIMILLQ